MRQVTVTKGSVHTRPLGEKWEVLTAIVPISLYAAVVKVSEELGVSKGVVVRAALQLVLSDAQLQERLREWILSQPLILTRVVRKKVIVDG